MTTALNKRPHINDWGNMTLVEGYSRQRADGYYERLVETVLAEPDYDYSIDDPDPCPVWPPRVSGDPYTDPPALDPRTVPDREGLNAILATVRRRERAESLHT